MRFLLALPLLGASVAGARGRSRPRRPSHRLVPVVVASHSDSDHHLEMELHALDEAGLPAVVLGMGRDGRFKPDHLRRFLESASKGWTPHSGNGSLIDPLDVLLAIDGFDVLPNGCNWQDVLRKFHAKDCDVVVGAEKKCYPEVMREKGFCQLFEEHAKLDPSGPSLPYPNGGCIVGYAHALLELYRRPFSDELLELLAPARDDQVWTSMLLADTIRNGSTHGYRVCLDTQGDICYSLHDVTDMSWVKTPRDQTVIRPAHHHSYPCFLHFNGPWWIKHFFEEVFATSFAHSAEGSRLLEKAMATRTAMTDVMAEGDRRWEEVQTLGGWATGAGD